MSEEREIDWGSIIHPIIDPLVENPESVMIRVDDAHNEKGIRLLIVAEDHDTARLVGKKGIVASALRDVVGMVTKANGTNERVFLKFESFGNEEQESE